MSEPAAARVLGVDIGCDKLVGALTTQPNSLSAKLVRNNLEHDTTPSVVAFTATQVLVGEAAKDAVRTNPRGAIVDIARLIGLTKAQYDAVAQGANSFPTADPATGKAVAPRLPADALAPPRPLSSRVDPTGPEQPCVVTVGYREEEVAFPTEAAYGLLLDQLASFVGRTEGAGPSELVIGENDDCFTLLHRCAEAIAWCTGAVCVDLGCLRLGVRVRTVHLHAMCCVLCCAVPCAVPCVLTVCDFPG